MPARVHPQWQPLGRPGFPPQPQIPQLLTIEIKLDLKLPTRSTRTHGDLRPKVRIGFHRTQGISPHPPCPGLPGSGDGVRKLQPRRVRDGPPQKLLVPHGDRSFQLPVIGRRSDESGSRQGVGRERTRHQPLMNRTGSDRDGLQPRHHGLARLDRDFRRKGIGPSRSRRQHHRQPQRCRLARQSLKCPAAGSLPTPRPLGLNAALELLTACVRKPHPHFARTAGTGLEQSLERCVWLHVRLEREQDSSEFRVLRRRDGLSDQGRDQSLEFPENRFGVARWPRLHRASDAGVGRGPGCVRQTSAHSIEGAQPVPNAHPRFQPGIPNAFSEQGLPNRGQ